MRESLNARAAALIPDGCNTGVAFRTLLAVNCAALLGLWLAAPDTPALVRAFLDQAMLIEWGTLATLGLWCGARRLALRRPLPEPAARALCALLPLPPVALLLQLPGAGQPPAFGAKALVAAMAAALAMQTYFELRARAFSPVLAEARLQALQARIRPHFLFNSLNAVLALIRAQPRLAERTLEDLADLFRVAMQDGRQLTSLRSELDLCERYLAIEGVRLGERLQVRWEIADAVQAAMARARVPALILQPLLENAVHYGVEASTAPAEIRIALARRADRIVVTIANPVPERPSAGRPAPGRPAPGRPAPGNHMALANIRERLALLYDVEAELAVQESAGRFEVRLQIPMGGAL